MEMGYCFGYIENGRRNMSRVYVDGNRGREFRREGEEMISKRVSVQGGGVYLRSSL